MEETQAAGRSGKLLVFAGKPSRLGQAGRLVRNSGVWIHHLYSQVWRNSPGGNGCSPPFSNPDNVSCSNVFVRSRWCGWWHLKRRWRHPCATRLIWIVALLVFIISGCTSKRASLEKRYAEARLLFKQG